MPLLSRIRRSVVTHDLRRTLGRVFKNSSHPVTIPKPVGPHPFDKRYKVDTSALIPAKDLHSGHANDAHSTAYYGTPPSVFPTFIAHWAATLSNNMISDYTFIDIGSGKGRVVMLASENSFEQVLGIELNPGLATIAQANLSVWQQTPHACSRVSIRCGDALTVSLPDSPVLLYLYNPFDAAMVQLLLDRLQALSATRAAPIDILYVSPFHAELMRQTPNMQQLDQGLIPFNAEDLAVDAFGTGAQDFVIFRLSHPPAR